MGHKHGLESKDSNNFCSLVFQNDIGFQPGFG